MFTIPMVEKCPYTVAGTGVLRLSHSVISMLAGAIYDKDEWLALLKGTRSPNGMDVTVNELLIPLQERNYASCQLVNQEPLTSDIVGVVHSHHTMGAFFSTTDDTELNPRFPVSIVVAHLKPNSTESEELFGFSYMAEGKCVLPCGSLGIVGFTAMPTPELPPWPTNPVVGYGVPNNTVSLYHCPHVEEKLVGRIKNCTTKCGVETSESTKAIFGRNGKDFLDIVKTQTKHSKYFQKQYEVHDNRQWIGKKNGHGIKGDRYGYGSWSSRGDNEEAYLRHWGEIME